MPPEHVRTAVEGAVQYLTKHPDASEAVRREIVRGADADSPVADAICRAVPCTTEVEISVA